MSADTVGTQLRMVELQTRGVRAADALHIATASRWNADAILTADETILQLDNSVANAAGKFVRCYDSDDALSIL